MIEQSMRFPIFIVVSLVVFVAILNFVMRKRAARPPFLSVMVISAIVVVGGMLVAKGGHNAGWPWWVYYTGPAGVTLLLPPLAFRLSVSELWQYLAMAFLSSPVIHVAFSFFLGWHDYMPFLKVPSIRELLG
jgi:hypothetical protein